MSVAERRAGRLREQLEREQLDALFVATLVDVRYLTGFTGSSGAALVRADGSGVFLTDFRYAEQSSAQVGAPWEIRIVEELHPVVADILPASGRLGVDENALTLRGERRLREALAGGWELVGLPNLVARLREVKEESEIEAIRAATQLADEALGEVLAAGLVGRSERQVAFELEFAMRRRGAASASFPPIVACAENGALPHAQPTDLPIASDALVTIDWGAQLDGYCSDCTRTFATGEALAGWAREIYGVVLEAQLAGLDATRVGAAGRDVDAAARELIEAAGYGERFGHGLGHGVGLEVHEGPTLSRRSIDEALRAGTVVTVEPGIYLPGRGGVRIEDLVVVRDEGPQILTSLEKALSVVP